MIINQQQLQLLQINNQIVPGEGPKAVSLLINFGLDADWTLDITQFQERRFIAIVQTIFVDLSGSGSDLTITFGQSNQKIVAKAGSQGYYAVLMPNFTRIEFNCAGGTVVPVYLINVPIPGVVWPSNAGGCDCPDAIERVVDGAGLAPYEPNIEFVEGDNVNIVVTDDPGSTKTQITINAIVPHVDPAIQFVQKDGGADEPQEPIINFIEGTGITLTIADNPGATRTDVTIAAPGAGGVLASSYVATNESTASTTFVQLTTPDTITFVLAATTNVLLLFQAYNSSPGIPACVTQFTIDGVDVSATALFNQINLAGSSNPTCNQYLVSLAAGSHTIVMKYEVTSSTGNWFNRLLYAMTTP